jgi:hypothetical protein
MTNVLLMILFSGGAAEISRAEAFRCLCWHNSSSQRRR